MFEGPSRTLFFLMVLLSLGLLCRADDYVSNLDCAALRAMTGPIIATIVKFVILWNSEHITHTSLQTKTIRFYILG